MKLTPNRKDSKEYTIVLSLDDARILSNSVRKGKTTGCLMSYGTPYDIELMFRKRRRCYVNEIYAHPQIDIWITQQDAKNLLEGKIIVFQSKDKKYLRTITICVDFTKIDGNIKEKIQTLFVDTPFIQTLIKNAIRLLIQLYRQSQEPDGIPKDGYLDSKPHPESMLLSSINLVQIFTHRPDCQVGYSHQLTLEGKKFCEEILNLRPPRPIQ